MSEWWTYRPADFLMYSPDIYWRLFADLNSALWPLQPLLVGAGLVWLIFCARRSGQQAGMWWQIAAAVCAACWLAVAGNFFWQRFAPINWIAGSFAVLFAVQAALLAVAAMLGGGLGVARGPRLHCGLVVGVWALLGHPLLVQIAGRPWKQAEVFGLAPDPTAIGTLALLLLSSARTRMLRNLLRLLWPLPVLWCLASAAMFWAMGSVQGWLMLGAAILPAVAACLGSRRQK